MKIVLSILLLTMLSSCETMNFDEFLSFEEKPYQSARAQSLIVDKSFTYESLLEGGIAFINLNFTVPRGGEVSTSMIK